MSALRTLFPKVRSEIIRLLFTDSERQYHLRELSRLSGLAVGTLQAELAKLKEIELLSSRRDGNRLYFRANTAHYLYPELHGIALKTTGLREQLVDALEEIEGIQLAFVFGSLADDSASAESDVDLMLVGSVGLRALAPVLRPVSEKLGREINPMTLTLKSFNKKLKADDAFMNSVMAKRRIWIIGDALKLAELASIRLAP